MNPSQAASGGTIAVSDAVKDRGRAAAKRSVTGYYLSLDSRLGNGDVRIGTRRISALRRRKRSRGGTSLVVPVTVAPGTYHVLACADYRKKIRESNERNDCAASRGTVQITSVPVTVPLAPAEPAPVVQQASTANTPPPPPPPDADADAVPDASDNCPTTANAGQADFNHDGKGDACQDSDGDGTLDAADCGPADGSIHPGASDSPDTSFVDSNCDGIDGNAANSIFVSPNGNDSSNGLTAGTPKKTVQNAINNAAGRDILLAAGTYDAGQNGVSALDNTRLYGGYSSDFTSRSASTASTLAGHPQALLVDGKTGVAAQLVSFHGTADSTAGSSAYGIRAIDNANLTVTSVAINVGAGAAGAAGTQPSQSQAGSSGTAGGDGAHDGTWTRDSGGLSPAGFEGGTGGANGPDPSKPEAGRQGSPTSSGGGAGGSAGNPNGGNGSRGTAGTAGTAGTGGTAGNDALIGWKSLDGGTGHVGTNGAGGGGGGGGSCNVLCDNTPYWTGGAGGGGGAGGRPGSPGTGGHGGGASIGIYLYNSQLRFVASTITAGNGGKGGDGGQGGLGGAGGSGGTGGKRDCVPGTTFCTGTGGPGGDGGKGGDGGSGGGGAGGPSIGIYHVGTIGGWTGQSTTFTLGSGGAGGVSLFAGQSSQGATGTVAEEIFN